METPKFIKVQGQSYVFNGEGTFVFYVPEKYFSTGLAVLEGEFVSLFGILSYAILNKEGKAVSGLHNFNFPALFMTKPDDIEIAKHIKLTKNTKEQDYRLLKYTNNGKIVVNYEIPVDAAVNLKAFYRAFQFGNIPNTVPYDEGQNYFLRNILLTENKYNVSLQLIGMVWSESCRALNDTSIPFRLSKSNDMTAYQMINIKDIPRDVSPFTAFTSETWDKALVSAIVTDKNEESPLEKIMMD
jgi:hypothetical protein